MRREIGISCEHRENRCQRGWAPQTSARPPLGMVGDQLERAFRTAADQPQQRQGEAASKIVGSTHDPYSSAHAPRLDALLHQNAWRGEATPEAEEHRPLS